MSQKKKKGFFSWFQPKSATSTVVKDETALSPSTEQDKTIENIITQSEYVNDETTSLPEVKHAIDNRLKEASLEDGQNSLPLFNTVTPSHSSEERSDKTVIDKQTDPSPLPKDKHTLNGDKSNNRSAIFSNPSLPTQIATQAENQSITDSKSITSTETTQQSSPVSFKQDIELSLTEPDTASAQIEPSLIEEKEKKQGFFLRLKNRLSKTKQQMGQGLYSLFLNKKIDEALFDELSDQLLIADVGVTTTQKLINDLKTIAKKQKITESEQLFEIMKQQMSTILQQVERPLEINPSSLNVILMVGVNGVGKTTTIGKLAKKFQLEGKKVMLAAGDTFRAAAVEQLQVWGQRNNIPVMAQMTGGDAASVIFDAIQTAKARHIDVLIADTAGRLQNKAHLMDELKKIVRVIKKIIPEAPHEIILTLDAGTGQNAIAQVKLFSEAVGLTGIILTKLDGTAKGGVIFGIADQYPIAIPYIGIGESIDDLRAFNAHDFIEAIFSTEG